MKLILIGQLYPERITYGPTNVLFQLYSKLKDRNDILVTTIFLDHKISKISFFIRLVRTVLSAKHAVINVHQNGFLTPFLVYLLSLINRRNKYYLTVHGVFKIEMQYQHMKRKLLYLPMEKIVCQKFPNLICVSSMLKDDIGTLYKRTKNITVIPNGTDAHQYHSDHLTAVSVYPIKLLMVGGIKTGKGIQESLTLLRILIHQKHLKVQLKILGKVQDPSLETWFYEYLESNHLTDYVSYEGHLADKALLYQEYQKADYLVSLSKYDTFHVAIIEALAMGCPVIASTRCGAKDFIKNRYNGYLVALNQKHALDQLANQIKEDFPHPEIYSAFREHAAGSVKDVTWECISQRYLELFEQSY